MTMQDKYVVRNFDCNFFHFGVPNKRVGWNKHARRKFSKRFEAQFVAHLETKYIV